VSERKGLRRRSGSCLGGGDHPRATGARCGRLRAAITSQAKPERPHAGVADPSRVDGGPGLDQGSAPMEAGWCLNAATSSSRFVCPVFWRRRNFQSGIRRYACTARPLRASGRDGDALRDVMVRPSRIRPRLAGLSAWLVLDWCESLQLASLGWPPRFAADYDGQT
jgi:hypothetical protein